MTLNRDQILSAADRPSQTVPVPEWGGDVIVATMDGALRAEYEDTLLEDKSGKRRLRAVIVSLCAVDEAGNRLFTEADVDALQSKSGCALDRVFDAAIKLNKLTKADMDALEGNSETGQSAGS